MTATGEPALWRRLRSPRQPLRFVLLAVALMAVTYSILYYPYPPDSLPVRVFNGYLHAIAAISARGIRIFDPSVVSSGDVVLGRTSLKIVLDCGALDALALFASAVAAFPAPWRRRAMGVVAGSLLIALVNVGRIISLYAISLYRPAAFQMAHEEIFQFGIIAVAFGCFWGWTVWARRWGGIS